MNQKIQHRKSESDFQNFIEDRKGLSPFDRKLEAAKLIDQAASVDVDNAYETVSRRINRRNNTYPFITLLTRIAAVLTLPLLAFAIWSLFFQEQKTKYHELAQNEITWQEIESPQGIRSHVVLPDGTKLWLNAGSQLRYGIPFTRRNREVELAGEAFLEVAKNELSPFVVKAGNAEVEVLGTQFNVSAYPGSDRIEVALKEGRVRFSVPDDAGSVKSCEMKSNDFMQFNMENQKASLRNTNIEKYIAWHKNIMILDDTPMEEVVRLLEQWYGVKVIIRDESIKKYKFTTTFDNEPLFRVLELLELSSPGIKTIYTPGRPDKVTKKLSPSIVTITKK